MRLTLGKKLSFGFMLLLTLMLVISIIAYSNLQKVAKSADIILDDQVPLADASMESKIALMKARDIANEYILATDINKLDELENEYNKAILEFDMYIYAIKYGTDSNEFKTINDGKIYKFWVDEGFESKMVIKKGDENLIKLVQEVDELHKNFTQDTNEMMEHQRNVLRNKNIILSEEEIEARRHMEELDKWGDKASEKLGTIETAADKNMNTAMINGDNAVKLANFLIIAISLLSIILGVFIALFITRSVLKQLGKDPADIVKIINKVSDGDLTIDFTNEKKKIIGVYSSIRDMVDSLKYKAALLERIANGDLTVDVKLASDKDTLGISLDKMTKSLNTILGQVNGSVEQVNTGSIQVSAASQQLSQGASEQASSLEEITSSITEINSQAKQNAESATTANKLATSAKDNAQDGNILMKELVNAMAKINISSDEIKKIVKVIDDIAFQTNLLALNANVEAARAGKYGKGFAVVAEEVRNLASRSAEAVKETTTMVEDSIKNIVNSNTLVEKTSTQLEEIVKGAEEVVKLVEEIALASKEQAQGLDQINIGLGQIDQVTQENTASAEESASAAEELASQAELLKGMVAKFKLKQIEGMIKQQQIAHESNKELIEEELEKRTQKRKNINLEKHLKVLKNGKKNTNEDDTVILEDDKYKHKNTTHDMNHLDDQDFGNF